MSIDLMEEPRGEVYRALVAFFQRRARSFSLVWREDMEADAAAQGIRDQLAPYLLRTEWTAEWPGTVLMESRATVRHFAATLEAMRLLADAPGLYAWQHPDRPEDLAFYGDDGQLLLGSIAHEGDAWLEPGAVRLEELAAAVPGLVTRATGTSLG